MEVMMKIDPVCGMEIIDISNAEKVEYKDKNYYFCTTICKIQFEHDPGKYVKNSGEDQNADKH